jgi:hypothetical protein
MTLAEALADIRGYARAGRVVITFHAQVRMEERGVDFEDALCALMNAARCKGVPDDRWKVWGPDRLGDELALIVALEDGVIVVTVF